MHGDQFHDRTELCVKRYPVDTPSPLAVTDVVRSGDGFDPMVTEFAPLPMEVDQIVGTENLTHEVTIGDIAISGRREMYLERPVDDKPTFVIESPQRVHMVAHCCLRRTDPSKW